MKIIHENTERTYSYIASVYPYVPDETPDEDIGWQAVLTVSVHPDTNKPSVQGLGQFPYNRQQVEKLRAALDAVLAEMDTIEALQKKEQEAKNAR